MDLRHYTEVPLEQLVPSACDGFDIVVVRAEVGWLVAIRSDDPPFCDAMRSQPTGRGDQDGLWHVGKLKESWST